MNAIKCLERRHRSKHPFSIGNRNKMERFKLMLFNSIVIILAFLEISSALDQSDDVNLTGKFPILMPNVHPYHPELYLCTPIKVDYTHDYFIVGFEPNATMNTAHHMLLYGCGLPGSNKPLWNCGEMASSERDTGIESANPCGEHSQIIYAWARDAPPLKLPDGVGFKVGKTSPIKYIVLQVHYGHVEKFKDGSTDDSGVILRYTREPLRKQAGVLLLGTQGIIPPMSDEYMETHCRIQENKIIYPFAFRTHTHALGKLVTGYRVRDRSEWTLLGKRDPMLPQMFYPVANTEPILHGDIMAARCTMHSERTRPTYIGATAEDEMCNFYLMYYVEDDEPLEMKYCFSNGPPKYYWRDLQNKLWNIPDE